MNYPMLLLAIYRLVVSTIAVSIGISIGVGVIRLIEWVVSLNLTPPQIITYGVGATCGFIATYYAGRFLDLFEPLLTKGRGR